MLELCSLSERRLSPLGEGPGGATGSTGRSSSTTGAQVFPDQGKGMHRYTWMISILLYPLVSGVDKSLPPWKSTVGDCNGYKDNDRGMDDIDRIGVPGQKPGKPARVIEPVAEERDQPQCHPHRYGGVPQRIMARIRTHPSRVDQSGAVWIRGAVSNPKPDMISTLRDTWVKTCLKGVSRVLSHSPGSGPVSASASLPMMRTRTSRKKIVRPLVARWSS